MVSGTPSPLWGPCGPVFYTLPMPLSWCPAPALMGWVWAELWGGGGSALSDLPAAEPVAVMGWRPLPRIDSHRISLWHSAESTYDTFCNTQGPVELSFEKIKEVEVPSYEMLSAIRRGDEWRPRVLQVGRRLSLASGHGICRTEPARPGTAPTPAPCGPGSVYPPPLTRRTG